MRKISKALQRLKDDIPIGSRIAKLPAIPGYIKKLLDLLNRPLSAKGHAFPRISGPRINDRICVVGAGPAGIHMALSLKKKGYKNITIFEKTDRVGGKCFDIDFGGIVQPEGAVFLNGDYFGEMVELGEKYGAGKIVESPKQNVR